MNFVHHRHSSGNKRFLGSRLIQHGSIWQSTKMFRCDSCLAPTMPPFLSILIPPGPSLCQSLTSLHLLSHILLIESSLFPARFGCVILHPRFLNRFVLTLTPASPLSRVIRHRLPPLRSKIYPHFRRMGQR